MKKKHVVLIFSGYNERALIAFLRTLDSTNIEYFIITSNKNDFIYKTKYKSNILLERQDDSLDLDLFVEIHDRLKDEFESFLLAPSTEYLNRIILEKRQQLERLSFLIPLVEQKQYEKISDKYSFTKLCKTYELLVPNSSINISDIDFPIVAKPFKYKTEITHEIHSPIIIFNKAQKDNFLNKKNEKDFFYQSYIKGKSIYLLYYIDKKGGIYKYSQENLIQQPNGKSILLASGSNCHESIISKKYEKMLLSEKFRGFIMVELKGNGDELFMIEANPRFWGPSQYFVDAGFNFFKNFLWDYHFITKAPVHITKSVFYFWDDGSLNYKDTLILNTFHDYSLDEFKHSIEKIKRFEIFNREDLTLADNTVQNNLLFLYNKLSKHSNYQVLASCLESYLPVIEVTSRFEKERLSFINSVLSFEDKKVIDIGGNTGFFSMEAIVQKAKEVTYIEGNVTHSDFVREASSFLGFNQNIKVVNQYLDFKSDLQERFDIGFLLNVLHHLGDDYGAAANQQEVLENIYTSLKSLAFNVKILIFQLGFNWKGNIEYPLFENGTKVEVIDFIRSSLSEYYNIKEIGVAEKKGNHIFYNDLSNLNVQRDDSLGEFLNRPLFILESKVC